LRHRTFNRWVVLVDEVALDELDGQARLADTTSADHDELVLAQELHVPRALACVDASWDSRGATRVDEVDEPWTPLCIEQAKKRVERATAGSRVQRSRGKRSRRASDWRLTDGEERRTLDAKFGC